MKIKYKKGKKKNNPNSVKGRKVNPKDAKDPDKAREYNRAIDFHNKKLKIAAGVDTRFRPSGGMGNKRKK